MIAVIGDIGLVALGFELEYCNNVHTEKSLKTKARINEGLIFKDFATSATDITDGLASELYWD